MMYKQGCSPKEMQNKIQVDIGKVVTQMRKAPVYPTYISSNSDSLQLSRTPFSCPRYCDQRCPGESARGTSEAFWGITV